MSQTPPIPEEMRTTRISGPPSAGPASREQPGDTVGPYRILSVLGEGGFGIVYLAERREPHIQRVALKIIKPGMDSRAVIARFEQERQALAVMDHPGVARVFDAGTTASARPYFVMELVQGEPITAYCDKQKLSISQRLGLFITVCEAVQHAHTKGVIHRDLKPGNVLVSLVDGRPVPKVIDFGVSKAISPTLSRHTVFTEQGQIIGTPEYMSPEQAELGAVDVDTRTDVYSLGVLLYELLTGTLPFETELLRKAGLAEIQRIIREVEPPRPSTRITAAGDRATQTAERRQMRPETLTKALRSELEWIPLKAMRKERDRRYRAPAELADDIRNYLAGRPLLAGPESRAYRARKFLRRNRGAVVAAALVLVALVAGLGGTSWGMIRARRAMESESRARADADRARDSAMRERSRAEAINNFLVHDMLGAADPDKARGREITVKDVMDAASRKIGDAFRNDPVTEASVRETLGETFYQLGRFPEAREQIKRAWELRATALGPEDRETLTSRFNIGALQVEMGEVGEATATLRETYEARKRTLGEAADDTLQTMSLLGYATQRAGKNEEALTIYQDTLALQRKTSGEGARPTLETMSSVADVLQDLGRLEEAEKVSAELVEAARKAEGPDGKTTISALGIRAAILKDLGRYDEAESINRSVLATRTRVLGEGHPETLITANSLAQTLQQLKRFDESAELLRTTWQRAVKALGPEHSVTLTYLANLARAEQLRGKLDEAEPLMRDLLATRRRVSGDDNINTLTVLNNYALLLLDRKRPGEAEPLFRQAMVGIEKTLPENHWMRGQVRVNIAECLGDQHKYAEAEPMMLDGYERLRGCLPAGHSRIKQTAASLAKLYDQWGKPDQAARWRALAG